MLVYVFIIHITTCIEQCDHLQVVKGLYRLYWIDYSSFSESRQRKQNKPCVATADSKEWKKRAVTSVYSLHSDAR
jgi:hypothetical protein